MEVADARSHELVKDNLAVCDLGVIAYLGVPLTTPQGQTLGSLCAIDGQPRVWTAEDRTILESIARSLLTEIAAHSKVEELRRSRERFELVARGAVDGIWDWNVVTNEDYFSERWCELLGYSASELQPHFETWASHLHPEDKARAIAAARAHLENRTPYDLEYRLRLKSGAYRWFRASGQARWDEAGKPLRMAGSINDITERKHAEQQVQAALHEKEVLLKEIHHRVKNNLQVISSILQMQGRAIADPHYRNIFNECQDRVRTMALVHEKLYRSHNLAAIDLAEEIRELGAMLASSYGRPGVQLLVQAEPASVDIEVAVPLGLALNELVSNALKYAFPAERAGTVTVTLSRPLPEQLRLSVRDNGCGLPAGFAWQKATSLGLTMVHALARQLRAEVEVRQDNGTEFVLTFPAASPTDAIVDPL